MLVAGLALLLLGLVAAVLVGVGAAKEKSGTIKEGAADSDDDRGTSFRTMSRSGIGPNG